MTETVELAVGLYGLRTFRAANSNEAPLQALYREMLGIESAYEDFGPATVLAPVYVAGFGHWLNGECWARCHANTNYGMLHATRRWEIYLPSHEAPQEFCRCGIYATLTLEHLAEQYKRYIRNVVAVIAAEGKTIIGDKGFRTQRARVVAYWCVDTLASVCERQFVGAQYYQDRNAMIHAYHLAGE